MMEYHRPSFIELVTKSIPNTSLHADVLRYLEPHFTVADRGVHALRPEASLDTERLTALVSGAAEWAVTGVAVVSLADPFPRPSWLSPYAHEQGTRNILGETFSARFKDLPKNSVESLRLDAETREVLDTAVRQGLLRRLKEAAKGSFRAFFANGVDPMISHELKYGSSDLIFRLLCYAAAGRVKEVERIGPLVLEHAHSPFLGLLKNGERHKGHIVILVA